MFFIVSGKENGARVKEMLTSRCAACKRKLWQYNKIGQGEVLRCHKDRIKKFISVDRADNGRIYCTCGKDIAIDKGSFYKMIAKAFTYKGTKVRHRKRKLKMPVYWTI